MLAEIKHFVYISGLKPFQLNLIKQNNETPLRAYNNNYIIAIIIKSNETTTNVIHFNLLFVTKYK